MPNKIGIFCWFSNNFLELPNPRSLIEALQILVDMFPQMKLRQQAMEEKIRSKKLDNQLKEEEVKKERLENLGYTVEIVQKVDAMVELLYPGLGEEKKSFVRQSLMKDILLLAGDRTLEISLLLPPAPSEQQNNQISLQESSAQISKKTASA